MTTGVKQRKKNENDLPSEVQRTAPEFFFTSLAAIYEVFTAEQIGCRVNRLYNIGLPDGKPYRGRRCEISREDIHSKAQKAPNTGANFSDDSLHEQKE